MKYTHTQLFKNKYIIPSNIISLLEQSSICFNFVSFIIMKYKLFVQNFIDFLTMFVNFYVIYMTFVVILIRVNKFVYKALCDGNYICNL